MLLIRGRRLLLAGRSKVLFAPIHGTFFVVAPGPVPLTPNAAVCFIQIIVQRVIWPAEI